MSCICIYIYILYKLYVYFTQTYYTVIRVSLQYHMRIKYGPRHKGTIYANLLLRVPVLCGINWLYGAMCLGEDPSLQTYPQHIPTAVIEMNCLSAAAIVVIWLSPLELKQ